MKTSNKILVYDDNCPLCMWYTSLFVKYKLLAAEKRVAFSSVSPALLGLIDFEKAKNEIPLIDQENKTVHYGFDALINILGERFPFIEKAGTIKPVNWFFKKLYKFVSLNRKVVVAKKCSSGDIDCSPSFNIKYRILLLMLSVASCICLLPSIHLVLKEWLPYYAGTSRQLLLSAILLASITSTAAAFLDKQKAIEYLGQQAMLGILLLILLTPLMLLKTIPSVPTWIITPYFTLIAFVIVKEYLRRMRYIGKFGKQATTLAINSLSSLLFLISLFVEL